MDQELPEAFKAHYLRYLRKRTIASATVIITSDDISIAILDALHWIDSARISVTNTTIRNTFGSTRCGNLPVVNPAEFLEKPSRTSQLKRKKPIEELDRVLEHRTIGGETIATYDFTVSMKRFCDDCILFFILLL